MRERAIMSPSNTTPAPKWTKESISELLRTSNTAVERGITRIFERQTQDEQNTDSTNHNNGRGFTGVDAPFMSSLAKQIEKKAHYRVAEGCRLSEKQMLYARKKIMKYAGQLLVVIAEKEKTA